MAANQITGVVRNITLRILEQARLEKKQLSVVLVGEDNTIFMSPELTDIQKSDGTTYIADIEGKGSVAIVQRDENILNFTFYGYDRLEETPKDDLEHQATRV